MPITHKNEKDIKNRIKTNSQKICKKKDNLSFNEDKLSSIIDIYKEIRDNTKEYMTKDNNGDVVIDRHKVASVFIIAVVYIEPIEIIDIQKATPSDRHANILLSYFVAISIIVDFFLEETKGEINLTRYVPDKSYIDEYAKLIYNNLSLLNGVAKSPQNTTYSYNTILFFLSHIFFYIEKNAILKLEKKVLQNKYDDLEKKIQTIEDK